MKRTVEEIQDTVQSRMDDRNNLYRDMNRSQSAWSGKIWDKTKQQALAIDGKRQVTTPVPYNTANLAMRLIDAKPKIQVPTTGEGAEADKDAEIVERWLNTMWENIAVEQVADPIVGATWKSFVLGRHCLQFLWIEDELPSSIADQRLPFTVRTLDPRNAGTYHNGIYTEYGWHKYDEKLSSVSARYGLRNKKMWKTRDMEEEVCVIDYYWMEDDGVWNAVIVDDEFVKKPTKTNYLMIPIVEGFGDYAPLSTEEERSMSLLAPLIDSWLYDCDLKSQMATGILYYFWPFLIAVNDQGHPIEDITIRPGMIKAYPAGTRIDSVIGSPNSELVKDMSRMMEASIQQSSFPEVLHGKAPGDVQAGYGIDLLAQSARGRINSFRQNLERTISTINMIALNTLSWPNVSKKKGITVYGYSPAAQSGKYYTVNEKQVDGKYRTIVNLKVDLDSSKLQKQTFWLRLVEAGIISKRTFLESVLPDEVPEDELERAMVQQALESDEMKPKTMLAALRKNFPEDGETSDKLATWRELIENTPFAALIAQEGGPQGPPTPPANGDMAQMLGGMPPGMAGPPPQAGPPPGMPPQGPPIQASMPMSPVMPVETQGGLTPEAMGAGSNFPPELWDMLMNQPPESLIAMLNRLQEQGGQQ